MDFIKRKKKQLAILLTFCIMALFLPQETFAEKTMVESGKVVMSIGQKGYMVDSFFKESDIAPYIDSDRIMVPVAFIAPALGSKPAIWHSEDNKVEIEKDGIKTFLYIGKNYMEVDEKIIDIDVPAKLIQVAEGGRTMLPIAWIATALNVEYSWDNTAKQVSFYNSTTYYNSGIYGPDTNNQTFKGSITIKSPNTTLQNMSIEGNLIIDESVGTGDVFLKNINVEGNTYIRGGGKNSIHIIGGMYKGNLIVENTVDGGTRINVINANGISVQIITNQSKGKVILEGAFEAVDVKSSNVDVATQGDTKISILIVSGENTDILFAQGTTVTVIDINSPVTIAGSGRIDNANINTNGVKFDNPPLNINAKPGITPPTNQATSSNNSGGGGTPISNNTLISTVSVNLQDSSSDKIELIKNEEQSFVNFYAEINDTLQLTTEIFPSNASNKNIKWSVEGYTGEETKEDVAKIAEINSKGQLKVNGHGEIYVKAYSQDGSGKYGYLLINIIIDPTNLYSPITTFQSPRNTDTTADFQWRTLEGHNGAFIEKSIDGINWEWAPISPTVMARVIDLTPNTKYYFRLVAVYNEGPIFSNIVTLTTDKTETAIDDIVISLKDIHCEKISIIKHVEPSFVNFYTEINDTLQLTTEFFPSNASNKNITWSVEGYTGEETQAEVAKIAEINSSGKLTVNGYGKVYVKAYSQDGSNKYGYLLINIMKDISSIHPPITTFESPRNTDTTTDFQWRTLENHIGAFIQQSTDGLTWDLASISPTVMARVIDLTPNTKYYFRLVAVYHEGTIFSDVVTLTTNQGYEEIDSISILGDANLGIDLSTSLNPSHGNLFFQWQVSDSKTEDYEDIIEGNSETYTLSFNDLNKYIKVIVKDFENNILATSEPIGPILETHFDSKENIVFDISMPLGTSEADVLKELATSISITGMNGQSGVATISWLICDFNENMSGDYFATGTLKLPKGWTGNADANAIITIEE